MKKCNFFAAVIFSAVSSLIFSQTDSPYTNIGGIQVPRSSYAQSAIQKYIDQYTTTFGKQQLAEVLDGGESYRLYVRQELKKRNMPPALEYLPFVESDYNPKAVSRSGARGMWQFMDNSMSPFLKRTEYYDERYDPWKSTDAALTKLQDNYKQFKDWPIAIAAYNCGAGAMKRILKSAKQKNFWYISEQGLLRDQSVQYVPKLLAICMLSQHPELFDIDLPEITNTRFFNNYDYITTKDIIWLNELSQELKMDPQILYNLNPALLKGCTPPYAYNLRLLPGTKETVLMTLNKDYEKQRSSVIHYVQQGDTLWSISKKYKTSVNQIKKLNGLGDNDVLPIGKRLYIN